MLQQLLLDLDPSLVASPPQQLLGGNTYGLKYYSTPAAAPPAASPPYPPVPSAPSLGGSGEESFDLGSIAAIPPPASSAQLTPADIPVAVGGVAGHDTGGGSSSAGLPNGCHFPIRFCSDFNAVGMAD
eukprot:gene20681-26253_t